MPQPPDLSLEQRQAALAKAVEARRTRAVLKEQLKAGAFGLSEVFERAQSEPVIAGTKMLTILESLPAVGKVKARRTMESVGIALSRRVRGVGTIQRDELLRAFPPPP